MNEKLRPKDLITEAIEKVERRMGTLQNNREEAIYVMALVAAHGMRIEFEVVRSRIAIYLKEKK